ncbi:MAG: MgtC/SapB family protein [Proteobacteria bacterium]|nr:MgtC/SapB family protein [Pseudomonadota bacterium]MBU1716978.1 MgtC/SapB family protein [Pseudomonadota bacterium]
MHTILNPLTVEFWVPIFVTILCGGIIGVERQLRGKPAGIRTSILICLGTYIFVSLADSLSPQNRDPSRIIGQIVTGIGFIGAGVIMGKDSLVKGVTSAAVIWVLAGIGACIGYGMLSPALALTLVTVSVLLGVELLESTFKKLRRGAHANYSENNTSDISTDEPE